MNKTTLSKVMVSRVKQNFDGFKSVYIGRNKQHNPLCNPFPMKNQSDAERNRVCDEFDEYFHEQIKIKDSELRLEIIRLFKLLQSGIALNLQCFCHPKRCHGHTIKNFLETNLLIWYNNKKAA